MSLTQEVVRKSGLDNRLSGALKTSQFQTIEEKADTALTTSGDFLIQGFDGFYTWSRILPWTEGVPDLRLLSSQVYEIPRISDVNLNAHVLPFYRASWYTRMPLEQNTLVLHVQPLVFCWTSGG